MIPPVIFSAAGHVRDSQQELSGHDEHERHDRRDHDRAKRDLTPERPIDTLGKGGVDGQWL